MHSPTVGNEFLELVEKSELLSSSQVKRAVQKLDISHSNTPEEIARSFVQKRLLTPFQTERLLEGRYRGFVIDCYRVREVMGVGGMGCVYIAEDTEHERKVALKVLSSQHALDAGMMTRMKLEAHAGMKIKHPNVIETYRLDSTGAVNFMVMELMRGVSLHELVALHGPVKWDMACDMFQQVARGLHAAHKLGIIHRDVKPANVLIDANGVAKLLDFGLARIDGLANDEFSLAMIFGHDCLGTPDYIAPEQAVDSNSINETADVYSLGCTLYVALTGRVPFPEKSNAAKVEAHHTKRARSVSEIRPEVPDEVVAVVEKMMARDPADRYQSAKDVVLALKPLSRRQPVRFEFRQLVTLRAKQARDKEKQSRRAAAQRSSITSASDWLNNPSHHLQAELDTFAGDDTPAIRQPAPAIHEPDRTQTSPQLRAAVQNRRNVPKGWTVRVLKSRAGTTYRLTRVKNRVGKSDECEIKLPISDIDSRQCYIEYDGTRWMLHHESRSRPTLVNGKPEVHVELRHGSRVTFQDGTGIELLNAEAAEKDRKFRRNMLFLLCLGVLAGLLAVLYVNFAL